MLTTRSVRQPSSAQKPVHPLPMLVFIAIGAGILSGSTAPIFTRFALEAGAPALVIAFLRLGLAALVVMPFTLVRYRADLRALTRRDLLVIGTAGVWMALHFAMWVSSLQYVGVLIATVLVTSSPIWTAILEVTFLKARFTRALLYGLAAVLTGNLIISLAGGGGTLGDQPLLGASLAVGAAIAIAVQRTLSRGVRRRVRVLPFLWLMYGTAALTLLIVVVMAGLPLTGYSPDAYLWIIMLTIFPQLIGHSSFNYALRYLPATVISLAIQVEPVIATAAAVVVLGEVPLPLQVIGSAVILTGVVVAAWPKTNTRDLPPA
ncbi:MAG: DMT family transporter [bacterium]|nr:DMT family transporter [bacterium]